MDAVVDDGRLRVQCVEHDCEIGGGVDPSLGQLGEDHGVAADAGEESGEESSTPLGHAHERRQPPTTTGGEVDMRLVPGRPGQLGQEEGRADPANPESRAAVRRDAGRVGP